MTPSIRLAVVVPLARLVSLRFDAVGQVRALSLLGVPPSRLVVPPARVSVAGEHYALTRECVFFKILPLHEKEER